MAQSDTEEDDFQPRDYQTQLMQIAVRENTIIYLPTGSGKTLIAVMVLKQLGGPLEKPISQGGKISIILVNTIALVDQQTKVLTNFTPFKVGAYTGNMNVDFWDADMWHQEFEYHQVLVMTAQILCNIVATSTLSLNNVNLIIFDECHHAVSDHVMRQIMMSFKGLTDPPRVVGLTATLLNKNCTPGQVMEEVQALETTFHSQVATVDDLQYVIGFSTNPSENIKVFDSNNLDHVGLNGKQYLEQMICVLDHIEQEAKPVSPPKSHLVPLDSNKGLKGVINLIKDAITHIEMFGIYGGKLAVVAHTIQLERLRKHCQDQKLAIILEAVMTSFIIVKKMFEDEMNNFSKKEQIYKFSSNQVLVLLDIFREYKKRSKESLCGIIFVQRRFTAKVLYNILSRVKETDSEFEEISPNFVVGLNCNPMSDTCEGLYNTKMHKKVLNQFFNKEINLLVASNVLEEGVDIPTCTLVVNFDKPTNYRAYVQSKGRARHKNSFYYMMVEIKELAAFDKRYKVFQQVENILNLFLIGQNDNRYGPSDQQIQELYDEHELPPYYVDGPGSAQVSLVSAISLLCRYCLTLPSDKYTDYAPMWFLDKLRRPNDALYKVVVQLPTVCPIVEPIEGVYMRTKKSAKRAAALKACELLHKVGELDDTLLPKRHDEVDEDISYFFNHWPEQKEKGAGNTKKRRVHAKQVPQIIQGLILPNTVLHLHVIEITPHFVCETISYNAIRDLYTSQLCFGILSCHALPELCQFSLYVSAGEVTINLRVNQRTVQLTAEEILHLRHFHHLIFNDILKLIRPFLIFDNSENAESLLVVPIQKSDNSCDIDFDVVINNKELIEQKTEPNDQEKLRLEVSEENYLGKIVTPWYRPDDQQYLVVDVCTNLNAFSKFPSEDFDSYASYFNDKYHTTVLNPDQPLLQVKGLSKKTNCLKPRQIGGSKRNKEKVYEEVEEHLIPELCVKQEFPAVLWVQATLLPSILHRIITLLQAEQLRKIIAMELQLGVVDLPEEDKWKPLICDQYLLHTVTEEPPKVKSQKMETEQPDQSDIVAVPKIAIQQLVQDFTAKKLDAEYPWEEKDEPIDIERHLDVTLMDIQYYENFVNQRISLDQRKRKNEMTPTKYFPAIAFDKTFIPRDINLLKVKTIEKGPELAEIYKTLLTTKCNDVVNLERLETLGDSFLKLTSSLFIVLKFPNYDEGKATAFKGKLISNKNLYYIGITKNLGGYLKISDFAPGFEWKPPSLCVPKILYDKVSAKELPAMSLFAFTFDKEEQIAGVLKPQSEVKIMTYDAVEEEEKDENAYDSMYAFLEMQTVPDKTIADSVEALLGVYFESCGFSGGLAMLEWLGIIPKSGNIKDLLIMEQPNPVLAQNVDPRNIDFHIPSWRKIEEILQYKFKNRAYLLQALTHSSYTPNRITNCYQRLEFLGDAILDFLITCHIYETCGNLNPGQLTDLRSALVNNITFAGFTVRCGFHKFLLFSNSKLFEYIGNFVQYQESKDYAINDEVLILLEEDDLYMAEHVDVPKVLGDLFEALAGAVFLDSGMSLETVWNVFYRIMWKEIELFRNNVPKNAVRLLYETVGAHPEFQKAVAIDTGGTMVGLDFMLKGTRKRVYGFGENKALAKKAAAKIALRLLTKQ